MTTHATFNVLAVNSEYFENLRAGLDVAMLSSLANWKNSNAATTKLSTASSMLKPLFVQSKEI